MGLRRKALSMMLSAAMILNIGFTPVFATAANGDIPVGASALCEHHTEHTKECGYTEGTTGTPCVFKCELCNVSKEDKPVDSRAIPSTPESAVIAVSLWQFVDLEKNLTENTLVLPGVNTQVQTSVEDIIAMLPTALTGTVEGMAEPVTANIIGWACEGYQQDAGGNWPISGTYTFVPTLVAGYFATPTPAVSVELGGATMLANHEASIGNVIYGTLEAAVDAAQPGDTVTLLTDVTLPQQLTISNTQNITLDLNKNTLILSGAGARRLRNNGRLTIEGSSGTIKNDTAGNGTSDSTSSYGLIDNYGTLVINGGTYEDVGNGNGASLKNRNSASSITINSGTFTATGTTSIGNACVHSCGTLVVKDGVAFENKSAANGAYCVIVDSGSATLGDITVKGNKGGLALNSGTAVINGGSYTGNSYYGLWITNDGETTDVIINDGTFYGRKYGLYAAVDDGNQDAGNVGIVVNGGNFGGGEKAAVALNALGSEKSWGMSIFGGYFTTDPSACVAEGKVTVPATVPGYSFTVIDKVNADVEIAPADSVIEMPDTEGKLNEVALAMTRETSLLSTNPPVATGLAGAVGVAANEETTTQLEGKTALEAANINVSSENDVTIYVQPYLDFVVTDADSNNSTITLDIKPMVRTAASTAASADEINFFDKADLTEETDPTDGAGKNAVQIGETHPVTVNTPVTITIPLPDGFATANLKVKHIKENGSVYFYEPTIKKGKATTATFTDTNGFSTFVLAADIRSGQVDFDYNTAVDEIKTYTALNVGQALPVDTRSSYTFDGWTFAGISGTYKILTDDLLTYLSDAAVKLVAAPSWSYKEEDTETPPPVTPVIPSVDENPPVINPVAPKKTTVITPVTKSVVPEGTTDVTPGDKPAEPEKPGEPASEVLAPTPAENNRGEPSIPRIAVKVTVMLTAGAGAFIFLRKRL